MANRNYHDQLNIDNEVKLRELTSALPRFCSQFFIGIEPTSASRTRIAYAYDLHVFFNYIKDNNPMYKDVEIRDIPIDILDNITPTDIEEYLQYLKYYEMDGKEHINNERGIMRKLASLRTFYNYYFRSEKIKTNPPSIVRTPKYHQKEIIRLDIDEVSRLLDEVESGDSLTKRQKAYHEKTKVRDLALLTLLLGTGIRVSECVGLDIKDVDFKNAGIKIRRKGGYETVVYFGDEVYDALTNYMNERKNIIASEGSEEAFFLSMQNKRLNVRSVENLVKKYSSLVTSLKKITPHKLRSTYGTNLYKETGDIYLVADVLGHKDVNTTKRHYAAIEDDRRRSARNAVKLRENLHDEKTNNDTNEKDE
ncbi:tyrosine-type recombinase/integrase [Eubacterium sp.]|uniref:tyrosine-type recombinase/integrase n=1 Tax=Eubacterium sp. TaxID=142586 RepID=UPI0025FFCDF7|nr:tyrosine-type recombinase/integrase [Eubacterium sp.]MCR5628338.1 tyrosine-type recombinase/integrase [Eubacterium sp.]